MNRKPPVFSSDPEKRYVNNFKYSIHDEWDESNIMRLDTQGLAFFLEMEPCQVYRLGIKTLPRLARRSSEHLSIVRRAIVEVLGCEDPAGEHPVLDGARLAWQGIHERLTRREWLQLMLAEIDVLEQCGSACELPAPAPSAKGAELETTSSGSGADPALSPLYLPSLRTGQFQLPHLMTCGSLVQIGVRNSARCQFGPEAPLHVLEFSGQSYGDTVVTYLGEELRTGDMEVWGQLLKLAAPLPLGARVTVSAKDLLNALGRGTGGPAYKAVRGEIVRLQGARLRVRSSFEPMREQFRLMFPDDPISRSSRGPVEVSFQLLGPSSTDGRMWSVSIPREVRVAFGPRLSSWFSEREYGLLTRRREGDTVKRLYLLYRSHAKPWPFTVQELRRYLGSTMGRDSDLKASLDSAHDRLTDAGLIKSWRFGRSERRRNCPDRVYEVDY